MAIIKCLNLYNILGVGALSFKLIPSIRMAVWVVGKLAVRCSDLGVFSTLYQPTTTDGLTEFHNKVYMSFVRLFSFKSMADNLHLFVLLGVLRSPSCLVLSASNSISVIYPQRVRRNFMHSLLYAFSLANGSRFHYYFTSKIVLSRD